MILGMALFEALPSPRPGEVRWMDLRDLAMPGATSVTVTVVDKHVPSVTVTLATTGRWTGSGWARTFACPRCTRPAAVLRQHEGTLLCRRCRPALTARQSRHNTREWALGGELEDRLLRVIKRGGSGNTAVQLGVQLMAADAGRVDAAIEEAQAFLRRCDAIIGARGAQ